MKVEQENFFARSCAGSSAAAWRQGTALHGAGEIGIEDDRIRPVEPFPRAQADRAPPFDHHFLDRLIEVNLHAHPARHPGERGRDRAATTDGMKDAVLVFEEGENREETRAAEGRHAEIF